MQAVLAHMNMATRVQDAPPVGSEALRQLNPIVRREGETGQRICGKLKVCPPQHEQQMRRQ
jgi:hypothetical protein